ncbi:VCBS domain-containing protein, partial [Vibrio sp. OPT18]|uniref:VCBS domain-containing protein n=1 Tax=Vibrio sp. OPT18 TaxID=2778641 RepID=UPI001882E47E
NDGSYSFDPNHASYEHLGEGEHQQLQIPVTVTDLHQAQVTQLLTIDIEGLNDRPVVSTVNIKVHEDDATVHGQVSATDVDTSDTLTFSTASSVDGFILHSDGRY